MVLVTHWAAFPGGWLCPLRKSPAETPQAHDKVSAICSVEDGRMNWDEGGEETEDGKWKLTRGKGWGGRKLGRKTIKNGASGEGRKSRMKEVREKEKRRTKAVLAHRELTTYPALGFYVISFVNVYNNLIK